MSGDVEIRTPSAPIIQWRQRCANYFVWASWGVLTCLAAGFVVKYHHRLPCGDEYSVIRYALGEAPVSLSWLWQPHNEHRHFIGKLVYIAVARMTHCNWSAVPLLDVGVLIGFSGLSLLWLQRRRRYLKYTDALIPVLLLSLGQWENLLCAFQLCFVLWVPTACYLVLLTQLAPAGLNGFHAVAAGACLLAQPLFGSQGLPYGAALACWYAAHGAVRWRSATLPKHHWQASAMMLVSVLTWVEIGLYFVGLAGNLHPELTPGPGPFARGVLEFLASAWIPGASRLLQGLTAFLFGFCAILACLKLCRHQNRLRALGTLAALAAGVGLAAEVSMGRAFMGKGFCASARYVSLAVPALFVCYGAVELSPRAWMTRALQLSILAVALLSIQKNCHIGLVSGREVRQHLQEFEKDLRAGLSAHDLARRHYRFQYLPEAFIGEFVHSLEFMRESRIYPFTEYGNEFGKERAD